MIARAVLRGVAVLALGATPVAAQEARPEIDRDREVEVIAAALGFYSPPRNQVRWIESDDAAFQRALVERLGDRFLPWTGNARGSGGRLRFSPIEIVDSGRYRLNVAYRHRTPYHEGPSSTQTFLVGCDGAACRILARGPGGGEDAW